MKPVINTASSSTHNANQRYSQKFELGTAPKTGVSGDTFQSARTSRWQSPLSWNIGSTVAAAATGWLLFGTGAMGRALQQQTPPPGPNSNPPAPNNNFVASPPPPPPPSAPAPYSVASAPNRGGDSFIPGNVPATPPPYNALPAVDVLQEINIANVNWISSSSVCQNIYQSTGTCDWGSTQPPDGTSNYVYEPTVQEPFFYRDTCDNIAPIQSKPNALIAESCFHGNEGAMAALGALDINQINGAISQTGHVGTTRYFKLALFDYGANPVTVQFDSKLPWALTAAGTYVPFLSRASTDNIFIAILEKGLDRWTTQYGGNSASDWSGSTGSNPTPTLIAFTGKQPMSYDAYSTWFKDGNAQNVLDNLVLFAGGAFKSSGTELNTGTDRTAAVLTVVDQSTMSSRGIPVGNAVQLPDQSTTVTNYPNNILSCIDPSGAQFNIPANVPMSIVTASGSNYVVQHPWGTLPQSPEGFSGNGQMEISPACIAAVAQNIVYVNYDITNPNPGATFAFMNE